MGPISICGSRLPHIGEITAIQMCSKENFTEMGIPSTIYGQAIVTAEGGYLGVLEKRGL